MYSIGILLVVIGLVTLLDNFGILPGNFWEFFWPIILVAFGFSLIFRSRSWHAKRHLKEENTDK